jgi:MoaA/NifB/PqqE/SkfB family radical SAM enzyme
MYDFANLLFSGGGDRPCNARCPFCIGRQIDPRLNAPNLTIFPPRNLDRFVEQIRACAIPQLVLTGTNTDPQLYRHELRLIGYLREALPGVQLSLHTNGRLALKKMVTFNRYDRVCISLPSFEPDIYHPMMGVPGPPDMVEILRRAQVPVKVSCVITDANAGGIGGFLKNCRELGLRRVVLRKLYGERRSWQALLPSQGLHLERRAPYRGNPVYEFNGMQVTLWDFESTQAAAINLFSSGAISTAYLLTQPWPA